MVDFGGKLADASGKVITKYFRKNFYLKTKKDKSPVTIADLEAEKVMRGMIEKRFDDHGIMGEEFGNKNIEADYIWTLDPIDGTKSFAVGRPIFGTLISLNYRGKPLLGIIDQPITKERWVGVPGKTTFNKRIVKTRKGTTINEAVISTTSPDLFSEADLEQFDKVKSRTKYSVYGGDCYSYGLLASGFNDIVIETGLKPHDFCALAPVLEGAGAVFTDWNGERIRDNSDGKVVATSNRKLHELVLRILNG